MTRDQSLYRNVTSHLYFIKLYFIKSTIVTLLLVKRLNPMFLHTQCLLVPINADRCRRFATFEQLSVGVLLGSWCIARRPVPRQCGLGKGWAHIKKPRYHRLSPGSIFGGWKITFWFPKTWNSFVDYPQDALGHVAQLQTSKPGKWSVKRVLRSVLLLI